MAVDARDGGSRRIGAYDFGIKRTILRHLSGLGEITVVPASTPADDVLAREPDGVFLSNGPGDPVAVSYAVDAVRDGDFGKMVSLRGTDIVRVPIGDATAKLKTVDPKLYEEVGVFFG